MTRKPSGLLLVTDRAGSPRALVERIEAALSGGARWIWFRDRDLDAASRRALAEELMGPVRDVDARLIVGGDVALARMIGADGVHLGGGAMPVDVAAARRDLSPGCLVGVSAHSPVEVSRAAEAGADYATLSPIFATPSKPGYGPALGPTILERGSRPAIPVFALGGVTPANAGVCRDAGFSGIAVMGGVMGAADSRAAVRAYLDAWGGVSPAGLANGIAGSAR
ncbi:thiamine phosphate synthase [Methylobacterium sp. W2]|uniref:thiamine phosphate synthase n=1 Tax=Methylobacterium sp. W2 TaxID=2598107 RepID=UPI001D0C4608|nr:thiamine phosphate synthase [Methylobacterium sp. W2]MCC0805396.1 thiamine phosphate synthase [Methylobacterium sp. W2]